MPTPKPFSPTGQLWLSRDGENVLNDSRIALLEQIAVTGSITKAGQAAGISYRTAWLTIDQLNTLSDSPLVEKTTGGKSGGGAHLTEHGTNLIRVYRIMQKEHRDYLDRLREGIQDFDRFLHLTRKISLKTSARNQLFGVVESIRKDGLDAVVILRLKGKDRILSQITFEGLEGLGLRKGEEAYALIKANWITLAPVSGKPKNQVENELVAKIAAFKSGEKNAEVVMRLLGGTTLVARLALPIHPKLNLVEGGDVRATFQPSDVILGVAR
jgi:molybdate transport system regulatory protein